jgi:sulfate permease, SulP family
MKMWFPEWLNGYNQRIFRSDLAAGLTVGVMLIPQGMAYAMIAGLPPIYGLYASTLPLIIYAILGTSRQLAVGPVAMVSLLTASGIGVMAQQGTEEYIKLAVLLAMMVGVIQLLMGVFKLGFLVNFLSHPVISGFTSAAAIIIGLSQFSHLMGISIKGSHHAHEVILAIAQKANEVNWITLAIGIIGIMIIIGIRKKNKALPGQLFAVIFGIAVVKFFNLTEEGVLILGEVPAGLPTFKLPLMAWDSIQKLFPIALAISLVSFMESIAVAKAIQNKHRNYKVVPNRELMALGAANIGGAFIQSFAVTGGFSRTAVNDQAGAKTGMASLISAGLVMLTLLLLTPLFHFLPNAILASVILVAVFGLIDYKEAKHLWKSDQTDFWMLMTTFIGTLIFGIKEGIGLGVMLSLALLIFRTTRPHIAILGKVSGSRFYRNTSRFSGLEIRPDVLVIRFDAQLYFANVEYFSTQLENFALQKGESLRLIVLNAESINNLDSTAIRMLEEVYEHYQDLNIELVFASVKGPVRDALAKSHLMEKLGEKRFFMSIQDAIDCFDENCKNDLSFFKEFATQANLN